MSVTDSVKKADGIENCNASMVTAANREILEGLGFDIPADVGANDLVVAVIASDEAAADAALALGQDLLDHKNAASGGKTYDNIEDIDLDEDPYDLVQISLPGEYAAAEAEKALKMGLDVFMFSDNVSLEDEKRLKELAISKGVLMMGPDCGVGSIVEVNAESDFVAKNDLFVDYVHNVAKVVAKDAPADLDALFACKYPGTDKTVLEEQNDKVLVIGENIKVRRFARYDTGLSVPYVHMGGRIAVLVNLETESTDAAVIELGKDIAMQIAALNPTYMDKSDVSEEFIAKEKEIRLAQAKEDPKNAKKPDAIIEKIVMGGIGKYFKEICLLQQPFVKDDKVSVEDHIAAVAKQIGASIKLVGYTRFEKGEGIEKRQDDLAEEVAKLVK